MREATGQNLSTYLEEKYGNLWNGVRCDWVLDSDYSQELGGCCLNATLRDYAI